MIYSSQRLAKILTFGLRQELDEHRDRAASHALQVDELETRLAEKEGEIEELLGEIDQRDVDHQAALKERDEEWKATVEEAKAREAEAVEVSRPFDRCLGHS